MARRLTGDESEDESAAESKVIKTCIKCNACKPVALFPKKKNRCKACIAAYHRKWQQENKEEIAESHRKYRQENKEEIGAYNRKYQHKRYHSDPIYATKKRLRARMYAAVKNAGLDKKCASSSELIGISYQGLKEWLDAQFTEGMTWENRSEWHIDHIIPCDAFDLLVEQNQRICFWYKNLQPLWGPDNLQKSNTYTEKQALISAYCKNKRGYL